jgi:S-DNA-T family DNA segregation ATPase FtsK/SpoIIIE
VDDVDDLDRGDPAAGEQLAALVTSGRCVLLASATSASASAAFRGVLPALRRAQRSLVLDPHDPASAALLGERAPWLTDPGVRPPGRGVLVRGRSTCVVQVYSAEG